MAQNSSRQQGSLKSKALAEAYGEAWVAEHVMLAYRGGSDFIKYSGLLDIGHKTGMKSMSVRITRYPEDSKDGTCYCEAQLRDADGNVWTEIGDANPKNVGSGIAQHLVRMAATRAKARVLRDFTNVGLTAVEEVETETKQNGHETTDTLPATRESPPARRDEQATATPKPAPQAPKVTPRTPQELKALTAQFAARKGIAEKDAFVEAQTLAVADGLTPPPNKNAWTGEQRGYVFNALMTLLTALNVDDPAPDEASGDADTVPW